MSANDLDDDRSTETIDAHAQTIRDGRPHVVVVGAGFGGAAAVRAMRNQPVQVTWIDRRNHHLFQPLLYQVATAALSPADIAAPIREMARGYANVRVMYDEVVGVDPAKRTVHTASKSVTYDYLIMATGAKTSYFGHDDWGRHANGLKTVEEATTIRRKVLLALERADMAATDEERRKRLTFVLIGGGPTGVEMSGAIADLARHTLIKDFPSIRPEMISIVLVEGVDQVLPGFPKDLADFAKSKLEGMGVDVRTGTMVEDIEEHTVVASGERLHAEVIVWSAGVVATPVAEWLGIGGDRRGRVTVGPDLAVPELDGVFVIGDAALAMDEENGRPFPGVAPVAKQQGAYVGRRIADLAADKNPSEPFRYRDYGMLATVGRASAVAALGKFHLKGFPGWVLWALVHIRYLIDFRSRLQVLINWIWEFARFSPGARLILGTDDPE